MPLTFRFHSTEHHDRVSNLCEIISFSKYQSILAALYQAFLWPLQLSGTQEIGLSFLFGDLQCRFVLSHHLEKEFHSRTIKILSGKCLSVGPTDAASPSVIVWSPKEGFEPDSPTWISFLPSCAADLSFLPLPIEYLKKNCSKKNCFTGEKTKTLAAGFQLLSYSRTFLKKWKSQNPFFILYMEKLKFLFHVSKTSWAKEIVLQPSSGVLSVCLLVRLQRENTCFANSARTWCNAVLRCYTVQQKCRCWRSSPFQGLEVLDIWFLER